MSLCRAMQYDFMFEWGRYNEVGDELYSDRDLAYGIQYAEDYLTIGVEKEPLMDFDLWEFANWCREQLK